MQDNFGSAWVGSDWESSRFRISERKTADLREKEFLSCIIAEESSSYEKKLIMKIE